MKNVNVKLFIYILLGISALIWFAIALVNGLDLTDFVSFLKPLPLVVTIDVALYFIFVKWIWRWKALYGWLVPFPNLSGTWEGEIHTTWVNPDTGQRPSPIPAILTIKQTFSNISCVMRTGEMASFSYAEAFRLDSDRQIQQLAYSYTSSPKLTLSGRSSAHDGTMLFEVKGNPPTKLEGMYWTARKTTGDVVMTYRCKELLHDVPDELGVHPVG